MSPLYFPVDLRVFHIYAGQVHHGVIAYAEDASHTHASVGGHKQLVHVIEPIEFTRLTKPDANNPLAQAIVYQSGKPFNATKTSANPRGRNYLPVFFSREV
jgi:hypothetical protein